MKLSANLSLAALLMIGASSMAWAQDDNDQSPEAGATQSAADGEAPAEPAPVVIATEDDLKMVVAQIDGEDVTLGEVLVVKSSIPEQYLSGDDAQDMDILLGQVAVQRRMAANAPDSTVLNLRVDNVVRSTKANATIEAYLDENLNDEYLKSTYDEVIGDQPDQTEWNASHILVPSEEEAIAVKKRIDDGEAFEDVAKDVSTDSTKDKGGELGWFGPGQMVPEFEEAVKSLDKGAVSEPVQSQFGWHVVKLNDTRIAEKPSYEDVEPQLRDFARSRMIDSYVQEETEAANIEIVEGVDVSVVNEVLPE